MTLKFTTSILLQPTTNTPTRIPRPFAIMKSNATLALLTLVGVTVAQAQPITAQVPFRRTTTSLSHMFTRPSPEFTQHPNSCYMFRGDTSYPTGGVSLVDDCQHLLDDLTAAGPRLWPVNDNTRQKEIAVYKSCAFSVHNPSKDNIIVGDDDIRTILDFYTHSFSKLGFTQGMGTLSCDTPVMEARELKWKIDLPGKGALLGDLQSQD